MKIFKLSIIVLTVLCSFTMVNADSVSYAPENLTPLDYFIVQGSEWWTAGWIFGEDSWQHAGLYSRSARADGEGCGGSQPEEDGNKPQVASGLCVHPHGAA